jgi:flagellar biosynthesis anti-sigma factor FlgM
MKVNDPNLSTLASTEASKLQQAARTGSHARSKDISAGGAATGDDVHLSELVRSLRSLAADSPERQARLEQIARSYANGTYKVDANATSAKIVDDALRYP